MKKRPSIKKPRHSAFLKQGGRCFYCGQPMWEDNQMAFAERHGLTMRQARRFQCTGEHLTPHSQGGPATPGNIVAACLHCNKSRHSHGADRTPEAYLTRVRSRMNAGRWHPCRAAGARTVA
jgi:5-methylcytosine-specific restriction endonuclease McrA